MASCAKDFENKDLGCLGFAPTAGAADAANTGGGPSGAVVAGFEVTVRDAEAEDNFDSVDIDDTCGEEVAALDFTSFIVFPDSSLKVPLDASLSFFSNLFSSKVEILQPL